jgi:hypothetical protein
MVFVRVADPLLVIAIPVHAPDLSFATPVGEEEDLRRVR